MPGSSYQEPDWHVQDAFRDREEKLKVAEARILVLEALLVRADALAVAAKLPRSGP